MNEKLLKNNMQAQDKAINQLNTDLQLLKKEYLLLDQLPSLHLNLLKRYNGVTYTGHIICFVSYKNFKFGLITGELAEYFKGKIETRFKVDFEHPKNELEVKGELVQTKCGVLILNVKETNSLKVLQEHCLVIETEARREKVVAGTKIITYAPQMELIEGFVLSEKIQVNGEIKCQLPINEEYIGSLIFDEVSMPIGICTGIRTPSMTHTRPISLQLTSIQPLTIKLIPPYNPKVIRIEEIVKEMEIIVNKSLKEESKLSEEVENGILYIKI